MEEGAHGGVTAGPDRQPEYRVSAWRGQPPRCGGSLAYRLAHGRPGPGDTVKVDVLIVGAGPTGLVSAILLGSAGVHTLVVERNATTSDEPKAVTIDDVALRTLQRAGIAEAIYPAILPGTGTKYYGRQGQLLTYARGAWPPRHGHPVKNPFQQPELERTLLACARQFATVEVRFSTAFEALEQDAEAVTATLAGGEHVRCQFLLGCDGGRSTVRARLGLTMAGSSFREPWIVIDTVNDRHDQRFAMHHGDPARPHVIVPGRDGCCRYEFLLLPGEAEEDPSSSSSEPCWRPSDRWSRATSSGGPSTRFTRYSPSAGVRDAASCWGTPLT